MSKELNRISGQIACLDKGRLRAALISDRGAHCQVWQTSGTLQRESGRASFDLVVKKHRMACGRRTLRRYAREYRELKSVLGEIVPDAVFVATRVDGCENAIVVAETCTPWFNLAEPTNEEEVVPLLRRLPKARAQLGLFTEAARAWRAGSEARVIDLYGLDNLVLDRQRDVRYLDTFGVFFYEDILYMVDDPDDALRSKIEISLRRLDYLEYALRVAARR